ncbi:response regulator [Tamlana fucoidanivorans]|uniref:hybrid sensor histidine kinase/response regulator transcription factor n=1 Tax=Allotamlana fucoidanivorans TaxID=2583814 RepID=UPI003892C048
MFSITQDTLGYMWFATNDGLNKYDGSQFTVYRNDKENPNSLLSNPLRKVYIDSFGVLWIGGNKGVSRYDSKKDRFDNFQLVKGNSVRFVSDIEQDGNAGLWISTFEGSLYKFDNESDSFESITILAPKGVNIEIIQDVIAFENNLILATDVGLFNFDCERYILTEIVLPGIKKGIRVISKRKEGGFWVGTDGDGLVELDADFKLKKIRKHNIANPNSLCNDNVRSISYDNDGKLWVGTFIGLSIYDPLRDIYDNYYQDNTKIYALGQNSVRNIYKDNDGGMWLGTYYAGISYYHPNNIKFNLIDQNGGELSLSDNVVSVITENKDGTVWIGTNDKGLNLWDREDNKITFFSSEEGNNSSLSSNNIKSILALEDGKLLVGTHDNGLNYYDPKTNKSKIFRIEDSKGNFKNNGIYSILMDRKSQIWLGTENGLYIFKLSDESLKRIDEGLEGNRLTSKNISFLFEDSLNRIWVGTYDGLNVYYPDKDTFESYKKISGNKNSLTENYITCIFEDSKGRLWVGTNGGLNVFNELQQNFVQYTTKDGLSNNVVQGILEDNSGRLWISTNSGISHLDLKTNKFKKYTKADGVQNHQFMVSSYAMLRDSTFVFGGTKGITYFKPNEIHDTAFNSKVNLNALKVNNEKILPDDISNILEHHINFTENLILKSEQNSITLEFSAMNYSYNNKVRYCWKMENYDEDWICSENNQATYSNISPGEYKFRVIALDSDSNYGQSIKSLNILVLRPWWLTIWALCIYIVLLILTIIFLYKIITDRIKTINDLKKIRSEKLKLAQVNQMKIQFFTNITHEFRTPLTLILAPLEKVLEKNISDEWLRDQIILVEKNAKRLLRLINQLLEFRKLETNKMKLNASKGEIVSVINDIYLSFASLASKNNIIYSFNSNEKTIEMYFDPDVIEKIMYNLLSNSLKFTPFGGSVSVNVLREKARVIIEIEDSGEGIAEEQLELIFERYYSTNSNDKDSGTGIGLALSKRLVKLHQGEIKVESIEGVGTKFIISLPLNNESYSTEEVSGDKSNKMNKQLKISDHLEESIRDNHAIENLKEKVDTILIVEDNMDISNYLFRNFSKKYVVYTAPDGLEAYDMLKKINPSLVISDIMMPKMDGVNFCKKVKQNIKTAHIPIILLTAKTSIENQLEGINSGADDYIAKPFSLSLLEAKVKNVIKSRKRLKDFYSQSLEIHPEEVAFSDLDKEFLSNAKTIVEKNISNANFSVEIFAKEIGMSRSNLHLKLKAITGESATDFIKKVRFGQAIKLIEKKRYSISEIGYMVGFNSPSYFSNSFKKYFGYLPTEHS